MDKITPEKNEHFKFHANKLEFHSSVDWQTPDEYIEAVRGVLGEIDLDPASSDCAQERIKAKRYFTRADDGLKYSWYGRVFLNSAYDNLPEMAEKLVCHYQQGDVTEAIFLTHTLTSYEDWFLSALKASDAQCWVKGLIDWYPGHFHYSKNLLFFRQAPKYDVRGSIAFYFGHNIVKFGQIFQKFGVIK